jgi:flagellar motor switch protein FliN/FliY
MSELNPEEVEEISNAMTEENPTADTEVPVEDTEAPIEDTEVPTETDTPPPSVDQDTTVPPEVEASQMEDPVETPSDEAPVKEPEPEQGNVISKAQFMQLEELASATDIPPKDLERMHDLKVNVEVKFGTTKMPLEDILKLSTGSVIELDKLAGEPVDITANGKLISRAEIVVIEENFGIKILEIIGTKQKLAVVENS